MQFATYFNKESYPDKTGTINKMESLTDQSFKVMCEIEQLLVAGRVTPRTPVYDVENYNTASWTFEDWQNQKALVERKFLHLDEQTKQVFGTPARFFEYCSNANNYQIKDGKMLERPKEEFAPADPQVNVEQK